MMNPMSIAKYRFDCLSNTLYLSPKFYERSSQFNSEEYILLQMMRSEIPHLRVQVQSQKKRKPSADAHLSIKAMKRYISLMRDKDTLLNELDKVIEANAGKNHPMKETRQWFKARYPHYYSVPRFDADGYLSVDSENKDTA